jgi:Spy/CpxP family protein refolding chaperone
MKRNALLVAPMVVCLVVAVFAATSSAKDEPGVSSGPAVAQGAASTPSVTSGEFAGRWHHGPSLKAIMQKLGITDEQKTKLRALYVGFLDRTRKTRMDLRSLRDEKKTMVLSGKIDQQKLAQIDDQVVKLVSDLLKEKLKLRRDRLALMTPEQIGRIADWRAEKAFRAKLRHREGMHGHGW